MAAVRSPWQVRQLVAVLVVVLAATLVPPATPALANGSMEGEFVAAINRERAAAGLSKVSVAGDLTSVARTHSGRMADQANLHHNPNLGSDVGGWQKVGENVGRGPSVSSIHAAFMNSAGHKRNILDPDWTQVGVGVVVADNGQVWVTEVFRLPTGASTPASEPKPDPAPKPESAPTPASEPAAAPASSSGSSGSSGSAADATSEAPAPAPEPEPHDVVDQPLPLDRVTVTLARLDVAEGGPSLDEALADR